MKKLKIPKIVMPEIENEELAIKDFKKFMCIENEEIDKYYSKLEPKYDFNVYGLAASAYIDYSYKQCKHFIYAFIADSVHCNYYNAIVITERYFFHTYKQYLSAVKKMNKNLINGWKQWIKELYEEV